MHLFSPARDSYESWAEMVSWCSVFASQFGLLKECVKLRLHGGAWSIENEISSRGIVSWCSSLSLCEHHFHMGSWTCIITFCLHYSSASLRNFNSLIFSREHLRRKKIIFSRWCSRRICDAFLHFILPVLCWVCTSSKRWIAFVWGWALIYFPIHFII